jgi:hypothetical protein
VFRFERLAASGRAALAASPGQAAAVLGQALALAGPRGNLPAARGG